MLAAAVLAFRSPAVVAWPAPPLRRTALGDCLVLALLLHLLALVMLGSTPGGSAQPGAGVWGAVDIRIAGDGPTGAEPAAAPAYSGPPGKAAQQRWGGSVRDSTAPEAGAARLGTWNPMPSAAVADPEPAAAVAAEARLLPAPPPPAQPLAALPASPALLAAPPVPATAAPTPATVPSPLRTLRDDATRQPARELAPIAPLQPAAALPSIASPGAVAMPEPPRLRALDNDASRRPARELAPLTPVAPAPPVPAIVSPGTALLPAPPPLRTLRDDVPQPPARALAPLAAVQPALPLPTFATPGVAPAPAVQTRALPAQPQAAVALERPLPSVAPLAPIEAVATPPSAAPLPLPAAPQAAIAGDAPLAGRVAPLQAAPTTADVPLAPSPAGAPVATTRADVPAVALPRQQRPAAGAPDAGALVGHDVATPATAPASTPRLNLDLARPRGGAIAPVGRVGVLPLLPHPPDTRDKLADEIEKAGRPDCRTAYSRHGLLAVAPLVADAVRTDGCRW